MPMPFKRVLRHRHASAIGWGRQGYAQCFGDGTESLKSKLSNSQSLVWVVDAGGRGQLGVVATGWAGWGLDGLIGATSRGWPPAKGTPCPPPRRPIGGGESQKFRSGFGGGVFVE